jgi:putative transposase
VCAFSLFGNKSATSVCDDECMRSMQRVRLYPTARQETCLRFMLDVTRDAYNAMLQQRRDVWKMRGLSVTSKQQYAEITDLRSEHPRFRAVYRECIDAALHRIELAYRAFFRRCKSGEKPGHPRFKPASRWKCLEFPHGNRALKLLGKDQDRVRIPAVGSVRLRKGREISSFGRAFVVEKNGHWYAVFECSREVEPLPKSDKIIGVDRGVRVLAATSDGELIRNARSQERQSRVVAKHQRDLEANTVRDARGRCLNRRDATRKAAALRVARAKEREANIRLDSLHKAALRIVRSADVIGLEKLNVRAMTRSAKGTVEEPGRNVAAKRGLNRVVLDAGFGILARLIREKAAWAAREVISVEPRYSSQTCGRCSHVSAKSRRRRRFACVSCGFSTHADVNAALEIRRRAQLARMSALSRARTPLRTHEAA